MLEVASPFVRLRDGRIVPLRTLNEEQGDFVCLTHLPAQHEEDNPDLRLRRVLPYLKSLMPTFLTTMRCVLFLPFPPCCVGQVGGCMWFRVTLPCCPRFPDRDSALSRHPHPRHAPTPQQPPAVEDAQGRGLVPLPHLVADHAGRARRPRRVREEPPNQRA